MEVILVLDTDALWDAALMQSLAAAHRAGSIPTKVQPVLPTVAYAERLRQLHRDGRSLEEFEALLDACGIRLEPFGPEEARRLGARAPAADGTWQAHARDFLMAAHAQGPRSLVTRDGGPAGVGLVVLSPAQAATAVKALLA